MQESGSRQGDGGPRAAQGDVESAWRAGSAGGEPAAGGAPAWGAAAAGTGVGGGGVVVSAPAGSIPGVPPMAPVMGIAPRPVCLNLGCCAIPQMSFLTWMFVAVMGLVMLILIALSPWNILAFPVTIFFAALAVYFLYVRWLRPHPFLSHGYADEMMVRFFFGMFAPGALLALLLELAVSALVGLIVYQKDTTFTENSEATPTMRKDPVRTVFFLLLTSYLVAAVVEEGLKAAQLRYVCFWWRRENAMCAQPTPYNARTTMALMVFASLGFATVENFLYVTSVPDPISKIVLAIIRGLLSMPLHLTAAAFTAIRFSDHDLRERAGERSPWWWLLVVMWPSIVVHGTFDAVAFLVPAFAFDTAAIIIANLVVLAVGFVIVAVSIYFLRQQWKDLIAREDAALAPFLPALILQSATGPNASGGAGPPPQIIYPPGYLVAPSSSSATAIAGPPPGFAGPQGYVAPTGGYMPPGAGYAPPGDAYAPQGYATAPSAARPAEVVIVQPWPTPSPSAAAATTTAASSSSSSSSSSAPTTPLAPPPAASSRTGSSNLRL